MLRNLPNRAKLERIEEHLKKLGFAGAGLYLPLDTRTGVNRGYCFVRFVDEAEAARFCASVHNSRLPGTTANCKKRLVAVLAANQGAPLRPRKVE
jgi:RNA recognition motif-containing protein